MGETFGLIIVWSAWSIQMLCLFSIFLLKLIKHNASNKRKVLEQKRLKKMKTVDEIEERIKDNMIAIVNCELSKLGGKITRVGYLDSEVRIKEDDKTILLNYANFAETNFKYIIEQYKKIKGEE